jgi:hypothetical protein
MSDTDFEGMTDEEKAARIAHIYAGCLASVAHINTVVAAPADHATDAGALTRNIEHINIYLNKTGYWTTEDLTPLQDAVAVDQTAFNAAVAAL